MFRYFTFSKEKNYTKVLQLLVNSYNDTIHSATKMAPNAIKKSDEKQVYLNLYGREFDPENAIHFNFKKGAYVRTQIDKTLFEKGYTPNWSKEVFVVEKLFATQPPTYTVKSTKTLESSDRKFYEKELQKVLPNEFPYDTFEVIEEDSENLRIVKLNDETPQTRWIEKNNISESETGDPKTTDEKTAKSGPRTRSQAQRDRNRINMRH